MLRKLFYVVIGLAIVGGAIAMFGYRVKNDSSHWANRSFSTSTNASKTASRSVRSAPSGTSSTSSQMSTIIDVLNILVGVVGIWLAIHGIRVQKQALAALERSRQ